MSRYRLSDQARNDLDEIWLYIASDDPSAADRFVDRIISIFRLLAAEPGIGSSRNELAELLRSFPIGNYVIFYRRIENGVEIVRVLSGFRDVFSLLADE